MHWYSIDWLNLTLFEQKASLQSSTEAASLLNTINDFFIAGVLSSVMSSRTFTTNSLTEPMVDLFYLAQNLLPLTFSLLVIDLHAASSSFSIAWVQPAELLMLTPVNFGITLSLVQDLDVMLIFIELSVLLLALTGVQTILATSKTLKLFYDDLITFCMYNNISVTEILTLTSVILGFIVFDLFVSVSEEDVADTLSYGLFILIIALFLFLLLAVDIQYFYMVSSVSSGDFSIRTVLSDLVNNFLCALRIFFCWVRYVFYDLQVEFIDFSFHYTDSSNEVLLTSLMSTLGSGWGWGDSLAYRDGSGLWENASIVLFSFVSILTDLLFFIIQTLIGLFKLFIAFFLLWLIVDLFILKAFALSESRAFTALKRL